MHITAAKLFGEVLRAVLGALLFGALCFAQTKPTMEEGLRLKKEQKLAAAAEIFRAVLQQEPANYDAMVQLATVESWLHHYGESVVLWEKAVTAHPHDSDTLMGLARVLYWKGELARAKGIMVNVLAGDPQNTDALALTGDIALARGDNVGARGYYLRAQKKDPAYPDIKVKLQRAAAPLRWRFDAGATADHFDRLRTNEQSVFEQLGYRIHPRSTVWVRHDYLNHFNQVDNSVGFGGTLAVSKPLLVMAEVNLTPHNEFEPNWKFHFGGEYIANRRFTLTGDYKFWSYDSGDLNIFTPGFRIQVLPNVGVLFKYNISHNLDKTVTGAWQSQADFQVKERWLIYAGYARGMENVPPQAAAFFQVFSTGTVWNLSRRVGVRADYSFERRRDFYHRSSFGPGIRLSF